MFNKHEITRRALLMASPVALAVAAAPAAWALDATPVSRLPSLTAAYDDAQVQVNALGAALEKAENAAADMGDIRVPMGLLPNGSSPAGWIDLFTYTETSIAERIRDEAEGAKQRLCTPYAEALAPGRNNDVAAGIDAMRDRSLAALNDAVALRKQREVDHCVPALQAAFWEADEALSQATCALMALVPVTHSEGLEKAAWLRRHLHAAKGHVVVQEWDALIASIGGLRLPSFAEGL